jgi:hypothetical protein
MRCRIPSFIAFENHIPGRVVIENTRLVHDLPLTVRQARIAIGSGIGSGSGIPQFPTTRNDEIFNALNDVSERVPRLISNLT